MKNKRGGFHGKGGRQIPDLIGKRFGRYLVVEQSTLSAGHRRWVCLCDCGTKRNVFGNSLTSGKTKSCGCITKERLRKINHSGPKHPAWKGGRKREGNGYISVLVAPNTYELEHRYIMRKYLRRPLFETEFVHHKNGVRDDNSIENLELWTRAHPHGQRVIDKLYWAKQFLAQYESTILPE